MISDWQILVGNLAMVALIVSIWMHLSYRLPALSALCQQNCMGIALGIATISSMLMSIQFEPGVFFDLRLSLIIAAGAFAGPVSVAIVGLMAGVIRIWIGGAGAGPAIIAIVFVSLCAWTIWYAAGRRPVTNLLHMTVVALASSAISILALTLLGQQGFRRAFVDVGAPIALLSFLATVSIGVISAYFRRFTHERDIVHAALTQAPDFYYVKDLEHRFVITNSNVAKHHGRANQKEMRGLSDYDLEPSERAEELMATERAVLETGVALEGLEECLTKPNAEPRWFSTSKAPLHNRAGELVGLAGVTVDITERKRLEANLKASRDIMARAMAEMSDGLAMFNQDGKLELCNEQYRALFPRSAHARREGAHAHDIVRVAAQNGERSDWPADMSEESIAAAASLFLVDNERTIELADGRWLSVRTRVAEDGTALTLVSDITAMKLAEMSLKTYAEQMKSLAGTDSLTGLANRRTFDEALQAEFDKAEASGAPLAVMMIDVDHFKSFNDTYGHLAGDDCLKQIASCIRSAAKRASDVTARLGGEEFAILLPNTSESAARNLAAQLLESIQALSIIHLGGETGLLTASVGIASIGSKPAPDKAVSLLSKADAALYESKSRGRNRVTVAA